MFSLRVFVVVTEIEMISQSSYPGHVMGRSVFCELYVCDDSVGKSNECDM